MKPEEPRRPRLEGLGLATRLLLNNLLVIIAGAGTVLLAVLLIGPHVFQLHLQQAGVSVDTDVLAHLGEAFDQAVATALALGVLIAGLTATAISWFASRRVADPIRDAAQATKRLADGALATRMADPGMGPELSTLSRSVNGLASRLQQTEATRRDLTAELAHQLRTPIASIEATVEAIREDVLPVDTLTLDTLQEQSGRLRRLVADLEVVSRAEERQLLLSSEPVNITDVVRAAISASSDRYRAAGVALRLSRTGQSPKVRVDTDRLHEVITGLLDNALKATPSSGSVTVDVQRVDGSTSKDAVVTITDTGSGFAPEDAERIFQRFVKGDRSSGVGLGLTIARAIVEAHHGTLVASSDGPGRGARFTIALQMDSQARPARHVERA